MVKLRFLLSQSKENSFLRPKTGNVQVSRHLEVRYAGAAGRAGYTWSGRRKVAESESGGKWWKVAKSLRQKEMLSVSGVLSSCSSGGVARRDLALDRVYGGGG